MKPQPQTAAPAWLPVELGPGEHKSVARLALDVSEACAALGVGWDFWQEHIAPEVHIVRRGRRKLVAVRRAQPMAQRERRARPRGPAMTRVYLARGGPQSRTTGGLTMAGANRVPVGGGCR